MLMVFAGQELPDSSNSTTSVAGLPDDFTLTELSPDQDPLEDDLVDNTIPVIPLLEPLDLPIIDVVKREVGVIDDDVELDMKPRISDLDDVAAVSETFVDHNYFSFSAQVSIVVLLCCISSLNLFSLLAPLIAIIIIIFYYY